ncbi:MAG: hypothetical protein IKG90_02920 [Bacteroidales bacterium]|nr:hypothetical protein [Bacteroidales bacterium]
MAINPEELEPLVDLLDDRDTVVTELVNSRLVSFGPEVVRSLRNRAEREKDPVRKMLLAERGKMINTEFKLADLQDFITRAPGPLSLFEGSWIISSLLDWTLQRERYEDLFYRCSGEYLVEGSDQRTGVENIRILNHIFYHRLKFTLYDVQLRDPAYALVSDALKNRCGNPFVLAFIYLMICQISGLPVELLCFPGGFVPAYVEGEKILFYINLYRGGELFPQDRLDQFLKATGLKLDKQAFRRRDESAMLTLYLESLLYIHAGRKNEKMSALLDRALTILGPERYLTIDEPE